MKMDGSSLEVLAFGLGSVVNEPMMYTKYKNNPCSLGGHTSKKLRNEPNSVTYCLSLKPVTLEFRLPRILLLEEC